MNSAHIQWALFSGMAVSLLTGSRESSDIDLIVPSAEFEAAARLLPKGRMQRHKNITITAGDGCVLRYRADEIIGECDGIEVQLMLRTKPLQYGNHSYEIGLSKWAIQHREIFVINGEPVYMAPAFDTMCVKAIMQRGAEQHKADLNDIKASLDYRPVPLAYALKRATEMQLDARVYTFLGQAGWRPFTPTPALRPLAPQLAAATVPQHSQDWLVRESRNPPHLVTKQRS